MQQNRSDSACQNSITWPAARRLVTASQFQSNRTLSVPSSLSFHT